MGLNRRTSHIQDNRRGFEEIVLEKEGGRVRYHATARSGKGLQRHASSKGLLHRKESCWETVRGNAIRCFKARINRWAARQAVRKRRGPPQARIESFKSSISGGGEIGQGAGPFTLWEGMDDRSSSGKRGEPGKREKLLPCPWCCEERKGSVH